MIWIAALLACWPVADAPLRQDKYFKITVVDDQTGRGVPLVELRTVNELRYYTDSNGVVAFLEPGLMDQKVFFYVQSHGYEYPKDGFGFRGKALEVKEGGEAKLRIKRLNIAERLYRVTGGGIYADSVLVGQKVPLRKPILNGDVLGSDSVLNAIYHGKLHWFWGDTNRASYPLGNFQTSGAVSELPGNRGLDPESGVDLKYFADDKGFAREMAPVPGKGPTWLGGLVVLREGKRERMFAGYAKVRGQLEIYERGLVEFDDEEQQFQKVVAFDKDVPLYPQGHPYLRMENKTEYAYFAYPYPLVRVRAEAEMLAKPERYEAFTCLKVGSRLDEGKLDRDEKGRLRYAWKKNTPAVGPAEQAKLIQLGKIKAEEALLQLQDIETGKPVSAHAGSVNWNEHRQRWVMIAVQSFGTSFLGEVWYAEADTPLGPWVYARKIVTHDKYSFYNPKPHPFFDKEKGRIIFFEGTYSHTFSGNDNPTPRYDYNQIMYKLDLDDPRLALPVPIYQKQQDTRNEFASAARLGEKREGKRVEFFALDRPIEGTIPIYETPEGLGLGALSEDRKSDPVFHALPADHKDPPSNTTPLFVFVEKDGKNRVYSVDEAWSSPGYERAKKPLCRVWKNPNGGVNQEK
jgi:hypothetical protein